MGELGNCSDEAKDCSYISIKLSHWPIVTLAYYHIG
jgi:hypothetical protein